MKEVKAASAQLAEEGYLHKVFRPGQNKAKALRKGPPLPPYEFDETQRERLLKEYWNPAYKVEAFVSLESLARRLSDTNFAIGTHHYSVGDIKRDEAAERQDETHCDTAYAAIIQATTPDEAARLEATAEQARDDEHEHGRRRRRR